MKQILKYGKYNFVTCTDCGCEFSFDKTDIDTNNKVSCPCCNKEIDAPVKE
jgi:PHP family Zn ribbon phosphoesterase